MKERSPRALLAYQWVIAFYPFPAAVVDMDLPTTRLSHWLRGGLRWKRLQPLSTDGIPLIPPWKDYCCYKQKENSGQTRTPAQPAAEGLAGPKRRICTCILLSPGYYDAVP